MDRAVRRGQARKKANRHAMLASMKRPSVQVAGSGQGKSEGDGHYGGMTLSLELSKKPQANPLPG